MGIYIDIYSMGIVPVVQVLGKPDHSTVPA